MRLRRPTVAADALPTSTDRGSSAALTQGGLIMRRLIAVGSFFILAGFCWSGPAHSATKAAAGGRPLAMSVTQEASEEQRIADVLEAYAPLAGYLSAVAGTQIKIGYSRNMSMELQRTRTASVDILVGPAHIIGSALRYGYEPLATFSGSEKMVFVVPGE